MNNRVERVKKHLAENKWVYISGGMGLAAGAAGVIVGTKFMQPNESQKIGQQIRQIAWRPTNTQVVINLTERSTPSKPVHLVGTDLYFDSIHDAARKTGHRIGDISRNINGHRKDINGDVFELLQPA